MKKSIFVLLALAASLSVSMAQTIVNTGFTTNDAYADGDLATQNGWLEVGNTGTNAFNVTDAAGAGFAETASASFNTTNGNYVQLDTTAIGNAVDDEWDGVMDFTISRTATNVNGGDVFRMGLSTSITNGLGTGGGTTNQVPLRITIGGTGGNVVLQSAQAEGSANMLSIDAATMGWDNSSDQVTDQWRLSWKTRKTRDVDTYTMICDMENLDNPTNLYGIAVTLVRSEAYASSGTYYKMGRAQNASYNVTSNSLDLVNITIDNLSVTKANSPAPILYPTPVNAVAGNEYVNLSWDHVIEAEDYVVSRIHSGVTNTLTPAGITTNGYADTTVVNGNEYAYYVTSRAADAVDADSDPVLAQPDAPVTGTILDTTFAATNSPAYADGDLTGQNRWKPITASAPKAFNVDSSGVGFAETATFSNDFDSATGNQVYLNRIMTNNINAAWSGTTVFTLETTAKEGLFATNIVGTVTNIQPIAEVPKGEIFDFGISSDVENTLLAPKGSDDALITVRIGQAADMLISLNGYNTAANVMLQFTSEQLGWDPKWVNGTESNMPIFETEPISLDWTIRKTEGDNTYMGAVDATIGTNTYTGTVQYTDDSNQSNQPDNLYAADVVRFGMGHMSGSQNTNSGTSLVNVSIDALSLTHTNQGEIVATAPFALEGENGNYQVTLSWLGGFEADSFDVYRSSDNGASYPLLANTTNSFWLDEGPLTDLYTYFYYVVAKYGGIDSPASDPLAFRALGQAVAFEWNGVGVVPGDTDLTAISQNTTNGIINTVGTYTDDAIAVSGEGPGTYSGVPLYGIMQINGAGYAKLRFRPGLFEMKKKSGTTQSSLLYVKGATRDLTSNVYPYETDNTVNGATTRAAVRDSGTGKWYVSDVISSSGTLNIPDLKLEDWRELDVADLNSTNLMSGTKNPVTTPDLTQVDAVGFMVDTVAQNNRPTSMKVSFGSAPGQFDLWTDGYEIYNEDAARTNDYDGDGLNNVWEWGQGGDPIRADRQGITDRGVHMDESGNLIYVYPRLKDVNARPEYFLTESDNLVYTDFTEEYDYEVGTGDWPDKTDFEAVTNSIPTTNDVNFIQLNIE